MGRRFVVHGSEGVSEALSAALGLPFCPTDISFAVVRDGDILGGVLFNRFTTASLACHMVGFTADWINRDMLYVGFNYPFVQLRCERIFGFINESNTPSMDLAKKLGFRVETRIRKAYADGDQIVMVMEKSECRWLGIKPKGVRHGNFQTGRTGSS